jgi:hypothetical protein
MGCSSSRTVNGLNSKNIRNTKKFEQEKLKYLENHAKFDKITLDSKVDEDFKKFLSDGIDFVSNIEPLMGKYLSLFDEVKFSKNDLIQTLLEICAKEIIKDELGFKDHDVTDLIQTYAEHSLGGEKLEKASVIIDAMTRYISAKQRGCVFGFLDFIEDANKRNQIWKPIANNLKYNESYQMEALTIVVSSELLELNTESIIDICEIIECNTNLQSLVFAFFNKYEKPLKIPDNQMKNIEHLLDTVKNHNSIKNFVFGCAVDYNLTFTDKIVKKLEELVDSDKLNFLCLTKFNVEKNNSESFLAKFKGSTHMKGLIFDVKVDNSFINNFNDTIFANKYLYVLVVGNNDLSGDNYAIDKIENKMKENNKNFLFYNYEKDLKIFD